ncbi:MAG: tetratricopeptide repeat protein [Chloroflexi bacterium]|nr:tetratricopeptide repeat protein [Chloroflexota bacterium]
MPLNPPQDLPEGRAAGTNPPRAARSRDESFKRWLAVSIASVALFVALTSLLQADASGRNARLNREAQQVAVNGSTVASTGQQKYLFGTYVAARQYAELRAQAQHLETSGAEAAASAFITASEALTGLSPLLLPPYASVRASDGYRVPDYSLYESDSWVVTATLLSQRREAAMLESGSWDTKASNYVAIITIYAVVLFLFGLAATVSGLVRGLLVVVGLGLSAAASVGNVANFVSPVERLPQRAIEQYAQGYGLAWQGRFDDAVGRYDAAVAAAPGFAAAYAERGSAYLNMKPPRLDLAIRDYELALARGGGRYEDQWNLGWTLYMTGRYAESIAHSRQAVAMNASACGPMLNLALAMLAQGQAVADKAYDDAVAYCAAVAMAPPDKGLSSPVSIWLMLQSASDDIDNLLCQVNGQHCYAGRDRPSTGNIGNRAALPALGEKYRKRIKEAMVRLEYYPGKVVALTGAQVEPFTFGNEVTDEDGMFRSYVARDEFPDNARTIYAMFSYRGLNKNTQTVWKIYHDGVDAFGLRYNENWNLVADGTAIKSVTQRYGLQNGRYDVELYGNGELLATGAFTVAPAADLMVDLPAGARPSAPISVGNLSFADDFANNWNGWWTGRIDRARIGEIGGGEYRLFSSVPDDVWRAQCDDCVEADNYYYEVDTRFIGGLPDWGYGLTAHGNRSTNRTYAFLINGNGQFSIWKVSPGQAVKLSDWAKSAAVIAGGVNRLGVLVRGGSFEFYANGQLLKRVSDASLPRGYFGLTVEHNDVEVAFSNLRIWGVR